MALWVFGPADCSVSINRQDTPPSCMYSIIVSLAYTQSLGVVHSPFADAVDSCPNITMVAGPLLRTPSWVQHMLDLSCYRSSSNLSISRCVL